MIFKWVVVGVSIIIFVFLGWLILTEIFNEIMVWLKKYLNDR